MAEAPVAQVKGAMATLLHEYWEGDDGGEFVIVSAHADRVRPTLTPDSRLIFSLRASSWYEAMQRRNERLDYGDYVPPDGIEDHFYTDQEAAEQAAYLRVRNFG
jgi:hypothetical protein